VYKKIIIFLSTIAALSACSSSNDEPTTTTAATSDVVLGVDASLMLTGENLSVTTVECTLSDGTETQCFEMTSKHTPTDHTMGPWCPETIFEDAGAGGLWFGNGTVHDVSGPFIENLATFYNDDGWQMYDENGNVFTIETAEQCELAADPNIEAEYNNLCAQCDPAWVDAEVTYLIPVTPVKQDSPVQLSDGPTLEEPGVEYGPQVRGLAFNGVRFDHPADIDIIVAGYQIAPVDGAGGHVNNRLGYHYHGDTGVATRKEQDDGHSAMIGYALDGHALFAELDPEGNAPTDLDECRGHYDDTRGYHYHTLSIDNNEIIDCFYGAWAEDDSEEQPRPRG